MKAIRNPVKPPRQHSVPRCFNSSARNAPVNSFKNYALLTRARHSRYAYSTFTPPPDSPPPTPTPEMYLQVIESTASAPWVALEHTSSDRATPEDRLKRAYSRIFQIFMYLGRPQTEELAAQALDDFEKAPLVEGSHVARARAAIATLVGTIVRDMDSIPISSKLRIEHRELFDIFGALLPMHDALNLEEHGIAQPAWAEFWSKAQYVLITLGQKLDECGYGLEEGDFQKPEVIFKIHRKNLEVASEGFSPPPGTNPQDDIVSLTESGDTLDLLFQFMYPQRQPDLTKVKFKTLSELAVAAEKYQVYSAMASCHFRMEAAYLEHPFEVMFYAMKHGYRDLMDKAERMALQVSPTMAFEGFDPHVYIAWTRYYAQWLDLLSKLHQHIGTVGTHEHEKHSMNRWFALVVSQLDKPASLLNIDHIFQLAQSKTSPRSVCSHCELHIKSCNLAANSEGFAAPPGTDSQEIVPLSETGGTLELLFQFMYPQRQPDLVNMDFEQLAELAEAAEKYQVFAAMAICNVYMSEAYSNHPFEVMLYALRHGYGPLMDKAEKTALEVSPTMAFESFTPQVYIAWIQIVLFRIYIHTAQTRYYAQWLDLHRSLLQSLNKIIKHQHTYENIWFFAVISQLDTPASMLKFEDIFRIASSKPGSHECTSCKNYIQNWSKVEMEKGIRCMRKFSSFL
ncbi:hypothetical protein HWV62_1685 [Athelia sp. TMB]|nr:hypothetical protein HWV62_1685 [Athelia sp. TMB]